MSYQIVLIRHGESQWNKENRFTGWTDIDLSETGVKEAIAAGRLLKQEKFTFDIAYTSVLRRAIRTLWHVQDELDLLWIPVEKSWRLNERHYGALQGMNKTEMAEKFGEQQVQIWRRSYDVLPPLLESSDPRHAGNDPRYQDLPAHEVPRGESLKETVARFVPYWNERIAPMVKSGKRVLITAHGNSLRALVKHLENMPEAELMGLNIPTGIPLLYELDASLKPVSKRYLGDPEEAKRKAQAVAQQGAKK